MNRISLAALAAALLLVGCPIPQPLPDYPKGTMTPPRILADTVKVNGADLTSATVLDVPADCTWPAAEPTYALDVQVVDPDDIEKVPARWFVDYVDGNDLTMTPRYADAVLPNADVTNLVRAVPTFTFRPYRECGALQQPPCVSAGALHVVELVVSNSTGFFEPPEAAPHPYRSPANGFETQVYRWVFRLVPGTVGCPIPAAP